MKRLFQNVIFDSSAAIPMSQSAPASVLATPALAFNKMSLSPSASGYRNRTSGGLNNVGSNGYYWSAAANSRANAYNLNFNASYVNPLNNNNRANGFGVRAVRAYTTDAEPLSYYHMKLSQRELNHLLTLAYLDARKNERNETAPLRFELNFEKYIRNLADRIYTRQWRPSPQICFIITKPTIREVFAPAFEDRVVSHLLFNMIAPLAERSFIYDSYSCRKGKGTLFGVDRFEHFLRGATENWKKPAFVLSADIKGYFMHINKAILYMELCKMLSKYGERYVSAGVRWDDIVDMHLADYLSGSIIFRNPTDNCIRIGSPRDWEPLPPQKSQFYSPMGTGITIGDVMSQLFSNVYLNPFDQFCKRVLGMDRYGRYVDDARAVAATEEFLEACIPSMDEFLQSELMLSLHPEKTKITSTRGENIFLGADCREHRRYCVNKTISNFKAAVYELESIFVQNDTPLHIDDYYIALSRLNAGLGYLSHFKEWRMIDGILSGSPLNQIFAFASDYSRAVIKPEIKNILNTYDYAQIYLC